MTPHRVSTVATAAQETALRLFQMPPDSAGVVGAGAVALVGWALGSANTSLLWVVGIAMLLDLVVGSLSAVIDPLETWTWQELYGGIIGKLFRVLLIPTGSLIDWLYITSPMPLPAGYREAFPVTAFVMVGLAAAEITSILNHFRDGGVAPSLIAAVIRHLDRIRVGTEPPRRRHYDPPAIAAEQELRRREDREP